MKNEMTQLKAISYVLENVADLPEDVHSKLDAMKAQLSKPRKVKENKAKIALRDALIAEMQTVGGEHTATEWVQMLDACVTEDGSRISVQRFVATVKDSVNRGKGEKGSTVYSA